MKYIVHLYHSETTEVSIDCDSPHEAAQLAMEAHPRWVPTSVESGAGCRGYVGKCESCGCVLLEGDQYGTDEDGDYRVCPKCYETPEDA